MSDFATTLTLIGGPTLLIEIGGFRLLTDPTFDAPGDYQSGPVTLRKTQGPALSAADIGRIDAVLLTHDQHADNLDPAGRRLLAKTPIVLTTRIGAGRLAAEGLGVARGLAPWENIEITGADGAKLHVTETPARHGPVGIEPITGDVIGFLVGLDRPGDAIYVSGDTVWCEGVAEVARRYRPRLVIPFAGAARTRGAFHLTMDGNDAIETAHAFKDALIAPVHTDGWAHFTESGAELAAAFEALGLGERLRTLKPGTALPLAL
jgi:L-ascorbate metabolism protein UlaG (beta-lactamase superfamily)